MGKKLTNNLKLKILSVFLAFFEEENAELIAQKLKERGLEFGVTKEVNETDE